MSTNDDHNQSKQEPSFGEAVKTIRADDFKHIGKIPCARNSLLYGIGAAFGMGGIRFIMKRAVPTAANWAVASFCGVSLVSFELCQMQRRQKLERLHMIVNARNKKSSPAIEIELDEELLSRQQEQQQKD
ncbi:hypothetical protein BCR43DRAFT_487605 [Syncephalastrum racemosum]|uniref:Cytochrome c oxidase assembly protein COX20, mitochondrial n=1 Tax=Syncephalastrum racemosum TaxID=13706 RepID=A0A1X2HHC7_SYNRA|nr:hypothetical protein BCR43DRAFT_487605 [Syncephalastrum racemosum]